MNNLVKSLNDKDNSWKQAFLILLAITLCIICLRFFITPFFTLEFEILIFYIPTIVSALFWFKSTGKQ
jgi:uncharacterized protein YpmS